MLRLTQIVVAALSLGFAPVPFPKPVPEGLEAIQGKWGLAGWWMQKSHPPDSPRHAGDFSFTLERHNALDLHTTAEVRGDLLVFRRDGGVTLIWRLRAVPVAGRLDIIERGGRGRQDARHLQGRGRPSHHLLPHARTGPPP